MVYHGTVVSERIGFYPAGDPANLHYIEITKAPNEPLFWVSSCCDEDWFYTFAFESNSDYERIKYNIMEAVFKCESMNELLVCLSEIFEDGFSDILIHNECCEDKGYLN
jgi:hypothetical protein